MKSYKLYELGKIVTGYTPSTKNEDNYSSNDHMFIGPTDLKNQRYIVTSEKYISSYAMNNSLSRVLEKDDIVVDCIGSDMGNVGIVTERCISNQQINAITHINKNLVQPLYLYYYFLTQKKYLHQIGMNGSTMPIVSKSLFEEIDVLIHDPLKQQHIVDTIGSIDDLIESKQKENDKINLLIQSLFRKYTNNVEKIRIGELEGYAIIKSGITVFEGSKIYLDTASVDRNGIASRDYIITMTEKPSRANMQPIPKSIWFAKLKDSPKYLFVQDYMKDILKDYIFSTGFLGLEAQTRFIANYLYALITSDDFDVQKNALSIGATMQGINNDSFKEIMVPCLSIDQMNSIGEGFDSLLVQIYSNNRKIQELNNLKQLYLKKFFG